MKDTGTIDRTCAILDCLIRGAVHDRVSLARAFGMTVAAADRYIRTLDMVPGIEVAKHGRRLTIRWRFSDALREAGL